MAVGLPWGRLLIVVVVVVVVVVIVVAYAQNTRE